MTIPRRSAIVPSLMLLLAGACGGEAAPPSQGWESGAPADEPAAASASGAEAQVLSVVQAFLDALAAHDPGAMARTLLAEGSVHAVDMRPQGAAGTVRSRTGAADIASLSDPGPALLERTRDPEVRVSGRVAMVWAPYDFWQDGAWSHCGTDVFTLVEGTGGWMISSISYTVETDGCVPGPREP